MHNTGAIQRDLHLGNFLWDANAIYAIDTAQMQFHPGSLNERKSFRQLAMLVASLPSSLRKYRAELLQAYFQIRKWKYEDSKLKAIDDLSRRVRLRAIKRSLRKTLRTCTRFVKVRHASSAGVFRRDGFSGQDIPTFMQNLDHLMESGQILKRGNTCLVSKTRLNEQDIVIKRYNNKGLWHSFRHTVKFSRARKCWLLGHRLVYLRVPTARLYAFVEQRRWGFIRQSYIISEFIAGRQLCQAVNSDESSAEEKEQIVAKTEKLLENLACHGLTHGDIKPTNIMVRDGNPILIDLDSMKLHRCPWTLGFHAKRMISSFHNRLREYK
jgi:tRNA A-37 threonylcarbamoyl transferase component Bud32